MIKVVVILAFKGKVAVYESNYRDDEEGKAGEQGEGEKGVCVLVVMTAPCLGSDNDN